MTLNKVVDLPCPSSSRLARRHWEWSEGELSPSVYIRRPDDGLSFLATPTTLGTYTCLAEESGFNQTVALYHVTQRLPMRSTAAETSVMTTTPAAQTPPTSTTRAWLSTATPRLAGITTHKEIVHKGVRNVSPTLVEGEKQLLETTPTYLRELVAVSVLLVLCISMLLLMTLYSLRKRCRVLSCAVTPGGATATQQTETQALHRTSLRPEKESGRSNGGGAPNGSGGHLPSIST